MKEITIKISNMDFVLYDYVPEIYEEIAKYTNFKLDSIRLGVPTWFTKKVLDKIKVSIWIYNDTRVNAFATEYNENNYVALSVGLCKKLYDMAQDFVNYKEIDKVFAIQEKGKMIDLLYYYMLNFCVAHEIGHIVHGHLQIKCKNLFIDEWSINNDEFWHTQLKEYDADMFAAGICSMIFISMKKEEVDYNRQIFDILFVSYYLCFRTLSENSNRDFLQYFEKNIDEYDHPHPGIRMQICLCQTLEYLRCCNIEDMYFYFESGVHAIIAYEKQVRRKDKISDLFFFVAFSKKGVMHIKKLVNDWNELTDLYNKYAYCEIIKQDEFEDVYYFINEVGEFI